MPLTVIATNWPLLLGMGVLMLGAGLQSTLLGLRATLDGFPTLVTGVVMSCYYVGYVVGTIVAPPLLRQLGHIRVPRQLCDELHMGIEAVHQLALERERLKAPRFATRMGAPMLRQRWRCLRWS